MMNSPPEVYSPGRAAILEKYQVLSSSSLLGFVGILHDIEKMLGFVRFYAAGSRLSAAQRWTFPEPRKRPSKPLGAYMDIFPRLIKHTSPQKRATGVVLPATFPTATNAKRLPRGFISPRQPSSMWKFFSLR